VNMPTLVHLDIADTVTVTNDVPHDVALGMQLSATQGALFVFLDPRLVIELPPGASVISDDGFVAVGPTPTPVVPEPSSALLLAAGLGLRATKLRHLRSALIGALALFAAIASAYSGEQAGSNPGSCRNWVIASGREFRGTPPPNDAGATADIAELMALAKQRNAKAKDLIAYWGRAAVLSLARDRARGAPSTWQLAACGSASR
jgi:hypothetical protein